jgi:hypothetical protein
VGGKDKFPELLLFEEVVKPITVSQYYLHRCGDVLDSPFTLAWVNSMIFARNLIDHLLTSLSAPGRRKRIL